MRISAICVRGASKSGFEGCAPRFRDARNSQKGKELIAEILMQNIGNMPHAVNGNFLFMDNNYKVFLWIALTRGGGDREGQLERSFQ